MENQVRQITALVTLPIAAGSLCVLVFSGDKLRNTWRFGLLLLIMVYAQLALAIEHWYTYKFFITFEQEWKLWPNILDFMLALTWILHPSITCLFVQEYFDAILVFCGRALPPYLKAPLYCFYFVGTVFPIICYLSLCYYGGLFKYDLKHLNI